MGTTTVKNRIMDYLMWSSEEYDFFVFERYWTWCHLHGMYPSIIQQMLSNKIINRWFLNEYAKQEAKFLNALPSLEQDEKTLREFYTVFIRKVNLIYPKPLLDEIKRNRNFTQPFYNNEFILYAN